MLARSRPAYQISQLDCRRACWAHMQCHCQESRANDAVGCLWCLLCISALLRACRQHGCMWTETVAVHYVTCWWSLYTTYRYRPNVKSDISYWPIWQRNKWIHILTDIRYWSNTTSWAQCMATSLIRQLTLQSYHNVHVLSGCLSSLFSNINAYAAAADKWQLIKKQLNTLAA